MGAHCCRVMSAPSGSTWRWARARSLLADIQVLRKAIATGDIAVGAALLFRCSDHNGRPATTHPSKS